MTHLKNWSPPMSEDESAWFDACPKAVIFEIARRLGAQLMGSEDPAEGFWMAATEWHALHANGVVPQKPFLINEERKKREAKRARREALLAGYIPTVGEAMGVRKRSA